MIKSIQRQEEVTAIQIQKEVCPERGGEGGLCLGADSREGLRWQVRTLDTHSGYEGLSDKSLLSSLCVTWCSDFVLYFKIEKVRKNPIWSWIQEVFSNLALS